MYFNKGTNYTILTTKHTHDWVEIPIKIVQFEGT